MITSQDKELISRLIKKYAGNGSTEAMIAFVADNNGMLVVCKFLVAHNNENDQEIMEWVDAQCHSCKVDVRGFLYEVTQIMAIFQLGQEADSSNYSILGLKAGTGEEEIKRAYRKLSLRYHPDTNTSGNPDDAEIFVKITKAYHALLNSEKEEPLTTSSQASPPHWRQERKETVSKERKQKNIFWFAVLAVAMIVISIFAANGYRKKAMLDALQKNHVAFVPSQASAAAEEQTTELIESGREMVEAVPEQILSPPQEQQEEKRIELPEESVKEVADEVLEVEAVSQAEDLSTVSSSSGKQGITQQTKLQNNIAKDAEKKLEISEESEKQEQVLAPAVLISMTPTSHEKAVGATLSPEEIEGATHKRIESFLSAYTKAYEHKDLLSFSRFFDLQATENGKPLGDILPIYKDLFQAADSISLVVSIVKWQQEQEDIFLDGRFTIHITYKNSNQIQGTGEISFLLANIQTQLSIKELAYHFDTH